mmetsp:Transcript_26220/g.25069  ORF Transcript_26220/g.25069 Transcript_26220/m.25069 type:complete len:97 (+) Transcript_26220:883-1173(+)
MYDHVGCYIDQEDRALPYLVGKKINIAQCLSACTELGFKFFGIQWLGECRCGYDDYGKYGKSDICICNSPNNVGVYVNCVYEVIEPCSSPSPKIET